jgi:hypothetical protein
MAANARQSVMAVRRANGAGHGSGSVVTQFKPGQVANPKGRTKGSRDRLQRNFVDALAADFEQHGAGVIKIARMERPTEYLKIIASVLPRELVLEESNLSSFSDAELDALKRLLADEATAPVLEIEARQGDEKEG